MAQPKRVKLAGGVRVDLCYDERGFHCRWHPHFPKCMNRALLRRYKIARDAFMAEVSLTHGSVMLADGEGIQVFKDGHKLAV